MLGPITREQQDALWDYGLNIGMAFQIVDDLLDFTGEEQVLGKPVGGDVREGKMTLPLIHLYARGDARAQTLIRKIIDTRSVTVEAVDITTHLEQSAAGGHVFTECRHQLQHAIGVAGDLDQLVVSDRCDNAGLLGRHLVSARLPNRRSARVGIHLVHQLAGVRAGELDQRRDSQRLADVMDVHHEGGDACQRQHEGCDHGDAWHLTWLARIPQLDLP